MKKIVSFAVAVCMLLLACVPGLAAENLELKMAADSSVVEPGGTVTVTFALSGASDAAIEGISFYVNFTDGIWVKSSTINCGSDFMLSSYNAKSRLFSATIANGDSTPDDTSWQLLTLRFQVRDTAAGEQSVYVVTDSSDSQWSLFDSDYADLSCSGENAKVTFTVNASGSSSEEEGAESSDSTAETSQSGAETGAETAVDSSDASSFVNNTGVELEGGTTSGETFYYTESGDETSSTEEITSNDGSQSAAVEGDIDSDEGSVSVEPENTDDSEDDAISEDEATVSAEETISEQSDNTAADSNAGNSNVVIYVIAGLAIVIIAVITCITVRKKRK